jgi:hypothetical protein
MDAAGRASFGPDTAPPVLVDLGRKRRKQIKRLKRGEGPLVDELAEVLNQVRDQLGADLAGKTVLPVVVIYERRRRRSWLGMPAGC